MVAKFSVIVVNMTTILISVVFSAIVLVFRVGLSELFTSDEEVIEAVSNLTPLLAISVFLNGVQPILSGKYFSTVLVVILVSLKTREIQFSSAYIVVSTAVGLNYHLPDLCVL